MTRLLSFVLVPLMLLALAGCQSTGATTCCSGCDQDVAAQKACDKAKIACVEKKASSSCEKKVASSCEKKVASSCEKKAAPCCDKK